MSDALSDPSSDPKSDPSDLNKISARFRDPELEGRFNASRQKRDLQQIKLATALAVVFMLGFALLDYLVITENRDQAIALRLMSAAATVVLLLTLLKSTYMQSHLPLISWLGIGGASLFYLAINFVSNTPDIYLSGFVIILFFLLIFFPLNFPTMLTMSLTWTLVFAVAMPFSRAINFGDILTIYSQYLATMLAGNIAVYLLNSYRRREFASNEKVLQQQKQYADLLNRIFPQGIVQRMQAGESRIADQFDDVAVLFADIVGFTETAAQHAPQTVVGTIDHLFKQFDHLVAAHGVEKIKTIGDAYMVAAGAPIAREGHIRAIAELALDMLTAAAACADADNNPMRVRIGIHAGPVIAGVIGEVRFGYDLWGDTVNVAARMQSHAEVNSIQITEAIARELQTDFQLQPRGKIVVKGKGEMETWHLLGRKA